MNIKHGLSLALAICLGLIINGQKNIKPIGIGEAVPNVQLKNVLNYKNGDLKLSDFNGKLIILDFWNLACAPCIAGFPKMEKLQNRFGDKIQFIMVNSLNSHDQLSKAGFPRNITSPILNASKLPIITECKLLGDLFPHIGEPFQVWIGRDGKVLSLTSSASATERNISTYLEGGVPDLLVQGDPRLLDFSYFKSFMSPKNEVVFDNLKYTSVITTNLKTKGIPSRIILKGDPIPNRPIGLRDEGDAIALIEATYEVNQLFPYDRVVFEMKNPERLHLQPKDPDSLYEWERLHYYNYELILPNERMTASGDSNMLILKKFMRSDLERFFNVKTSLENRRLKCRILYRTGSEGNLSIYSNHSKELEEHLENRFAIQGKNFFYFIRYFQTDNFSTKNVPLLNETGIDPVSAIVDMTLNSSLTDIPNLNKELNKYGLGIREEERDIPVIVIRDAVFE